MRCIVFLSFIAPVVLEARTKCNTGSCDRDEKKAFDMWPDGDCAFPNTDW